MIKIGQPVYTDLYGRGKGYVCNIKGKQNPDSVRSLMGGAMVMGGGAEFDIVFEDGSYSQRLPEAILYGVQWRILDEELASAEYLEELIANSQAKAEEKKAAKEEANRIFREKVDAYEANPEYKFLKQGSCYSGVLAGKNIRAELKKAFPGVKFSVRKRGRGEIVVSWEDGPATRLVKNITEKYVSSSFDPYQDLKEQRYTPWNTVFGGADYINLYRQVSDEFVQDAIYQLKEKYPADDLDITVSDYRNGNLLGHWSNQELNTMLGYE